MSIIVRTAVADDRGLVVAMLREFMDYLNAIEASDEAVDVNDLADQGFGPDPVCTTLIAERDGVAVGYVGFHPGVWEIHRAIYVISLFVRAEARGSGAGRALMNAVRSIARAQKARRVVWEVWRKNPSAIDFYRGIGAEAYDDNLRMSLVVE
jgi:GNAT superfamily N-acetyltransferase